jgi:hypothetical protein
MRSLVLEGFGWNDEYTAADLRYRQLPSPLQAAQIAIPQPVMSKNQAEPLSNRKLRCSSEVNAAGVYFSAWLLRYSLFSI